MKFLYCRNATIGFAQMIKVENDNVDYDEFLPLAIKHALKYGRAVFGGWVFTAYHEL